MISLAAFAMIFLSSLYFGAKRILRYLQFLQQDHYYSGRFLKWLWKVRAFDKRGSSIAVIGFISALFFPIWTTILIVGALGLIGFLEEDPRHKGKLSLKMTQRASRIFFTALTAYAFLLILVICTSYPFLSWLWPALFLLYQSIPLCLIGACSLLSRSEAKLQAAFLDEAKIIIKFVNPYVIGITGSYGKTSTKDALSHILQTTLGPTFWPHKGINTDMGITKEIRTRLKSGYKYAVIEMGAYHIGSIKRLCELTPPHAAILTCIGTAHLERFGSVGNILKAKSELAQALPKNGILVCNGDNEGTRSIAQSEKKDTTLIYGLDSCKGHLDCLIIPNETSVKGTHFELKWQGKSFQGFAPLFGKPALSNIAAAFTMACALGSQPEFGLAAIAGLAPVDNRLQISLSDGILYLKDAYNSNSIGFAAALEVMKSLPGKKRIMMTPGIIELGSEQHAENEQIGKLAAPICDIALIVNEENRNALGAGLRSGGMDSKNIIFCATRQAAFNHLGQLVEKGDIVLIENDLPDLYEVHAKF